MRSGVGDRPRVEVAGIHRGTRCHSPAVGVRPSGFEQAFLPAHDHVVLRRQQHDDERREPEQLRADREAQPTAAMLPM